MYSIVSLIDPKHKYIYKSYCLVNTAEYLIQIFSQGKEKNTFFLKGKKKSVSVFLNDS